MHYLSYTSQRPSHFTQPYALPGDSIVPVPAVQVLTLAGETAAGSDGDVRAASNALVKLPVIPNQIAFGGGFGDGGGFTVPADSAWSRDSRHVHFTFLTRASKALYLVEAGLDGTPRVLAADSAKTWVETSPQDPPSWYVTEDGNDVLWWSERDGWAELYRLGHEGQLKNRITTGAWPVGAGRHVAGKVKPLYFPARRPGAGPVPVLRAPVSRQLRRHRPHAAHPGRCRSSYRVLAQRRVFPGHTVPRRRAPHHAAQSRARWEGRSQGGTGRPFTAQGGGVDPGRGVYRQGARRDHRSLRRDVQAVEFRLDRELSGHRPHLPGPPGRQRRRLPFQYGRRGSSAGRAGLHRAQDRPPGHSAALESLP